MKVLQLTVHYHPNLGGVETHLLDLVGELLRKNYQVFVLTYRPLSVRAKWTILEKSSLLTVLRIPWLPGLFNRLSLYPMWEFLYLFPGLFLLLPFILLVFRPDVIHAHGLVAAFVGVIWGRLFGIRVVISTHSIYHFPPTGLYRWLARVVFESAGYNLCLSNQSVTELKTLGVSNKKVGRFTYWVDLQKFRPLNKQKCKKELGWSNQFVVLFLGRLVAEKGVPELLQAAKLFASQIRLVIAGSGPLESLVKRYYIGRISQDRLPVYYSASDVVVVPSTHEEGFGRVILESLACGAPVVAANRGAIPEAMDETVGRLITINPKNIADTINFLSKNKRRLNKYSKNARDFAQSKYNSSNLNEITHAYLNIDSKRFSN